MTKRDAIIDAAVREFGEYSYDAASVNRIISSSGTSKGTFYHYFKDKKELYFTIIENSVKIKQEYFVSMFAQMHSEGNDFFDMMKDQAKIAAVFMREHPDLYQFGIQFAREQNPVKDEVFAKVVPEVSASFAGIIAAAVSRGNISDRYPSDFVERIVSHLSINYYDILFDRNEQPEIGELWKRLDMMFDFMKRGLT
ncbi:MAG: TetR/AcrR family transcriptional regulator [Clostridia bacterium]|nr:TetR/AcrR family transcriptional regulator [Clostridia bacterium]NCC69097.1 TetR/AcrR family transcriptional regulator [Clostridia bacterium]